MGAKYFSCVYYDLRAVHFSADMNSNRVYRAFESPGFTFELRSRQCIAQACLIISIRISAAINTRFGRFPGNLNEQLPSKEHYCLWAVRHAELLTCI